MMESKEISIGKRKLTVHQHTFGMQLRRFAMMEAAQQDPPIEDDSPLVASIRNGFHRMTYPGLATCTQGKVPTEQECYDAITDDELNAWLAAARELNPDWFPSGEETAEQAEKKE
jgi:hypothetical protein